MSSWKELKRHPLSAEYEDITGPAWFSFTLFLKNNGIVKGRKITLHEGMILDGYQLFRACLEVGIEPEFAVLEEGIDPEVFVQAYNDQRRKTENAEQVSRRTEARRERVADARKKGESLRSIAEKEEVSHTTIKDDLEKIAGKGLQSEPKSGKVTGKDGRKQPAKKPSTVLCRHCEHRKIVGKPLIENCPDCAELRKVLKPTKAKKKVVEPEEEEKPITDDAGTVVPIRLIPVFKSIPDFAAAEKALNVASKAFKVIEEGACKDVKPVSGSTHYTKYYGTFKAARARLKAMRPSLVCSACNGDACDKCQDGFLTAEMVPATST